MVSLTLPWTELSTGVNELLAFKNSLPVALDFLAMSGWALLVSFPLVILAAAISFIRARRRKADFEKYRATVDSLKEELEEVKRQILSRIFAGAALPIGGGVTDARSAWTTGG